MIIYFDTLHTVVRQLNCSAVTADSCIIAHVLWLYYVLLFWRRNKLILSYMNQNANYIYLLPDILCYKIHKHVAVHLLGNSVCSHLIICRLSVHACIPARTRRPIRFGANVIDISVSQSKAATVDRYAYHNLRSWSPHSHPVLCQSWLQYNTHVHLRYKAIQCMI